MTISFHNSLNENLLSYFDRLTWRKGEDYFRRGKVLNYALEPMNELTGIVSGSYSNQYDVTVFLSEDGNDLYETDCSCPIGGNCKHTAALAIAYLAGSSSSTINAASESAQSRIKRQLAVYDRLLDFENTVEAIPSVTSHPTAFDSGEASVSPITERAALTPPSAELLKAFERIRLLTNNGAISNGDNLLAESDSKVRSRIVYILEDGHKWSTNPSISLTRVNLCRDGSFGAQNSLRLEQILDRNAPKYVTDADREIAQLWRTVAGNSSLYSHFGRVELGIHPELLSILLLKVLKTGRCYWESTEHPPLKPGKALPGKLSWHEFDSQRQLHVIAIDNDQEHECLRWNIPWYVDRTNWICGPVLLDISPRALDSALSLPMVKNEQAPAVTIMLNKMGLDTWLPPPLPESQFESRIISPVASLKVMPRKCQSHLFFKDGCFYKPGDSLITAVLSTRYPRPTGEAFIASDGKLIVEHHEKSGEDGIVQELKDLGLEQLPPSEHDNKQPNNRYFAFPNPNQWIDFAAAHLDDLRLQGWEIEAETEANLTAIELTDDNLSIEVEDDDSWWFSLALNLEIDGKKIKLLPILLSAIKALPNCQMVTEEAVERLNRSGKFLSVLPSGQIISFPFDRIRTILLSLQELLWHEPKADSLDISILHAEELLKNSGIAQAKWLGAEKLFSLVERLRQLNCIERVSPPANFKTELRPYQLDGLSWLQFLAKQEFGGILADDMGLGKTVQLLAHICLEKEAGRLREPCLVICPTSVVPNWLAEATRFAPQLSTLSFTGNDRFSKLSKINKSDLVLTTYPLLTRDIDQLKHIQWHMLVLDEAQYIKNPATQSAQAVCSLNARHRICMTGTPIENHLGELWSQFQFLLPGLLGTQSIFKRCVRDPVEKDGNSAVKTALARRVRPFVMRRNKNEVAIDLPEKTIIDKTVELEDAQRDLYETVRLASTKVVRDEIAKKGFKHSRIMILDALLKLRQVCCDPRLVKIRAAKKAKRSAKLEMLVDMLKQLTEEGRKILVFSQFTSMLDLIGFELQTNDLPFVELRGDTKDRVTPVREFQEGSTPIFLISLKAGGTGLNLTAADTVIHYDPWWNPAVEEQATDRAHRIGQTKKVFVYKLIAQGTIEQRMLEMQERKRAIAASIFDDQVNSSLAFSENDLEALLRPIDSMVATL